MTASNRDLNTRGSILSSVGLLFAHLSRRRRWQLAALMVLMVMGAAAEMATLGAVVPILALLADPGAIQHYSFVQGLVGKFAKEPRDLLGWAALIFPLIVACAAGLRMLLFWATYRFTFGVGADLGGEVYRRTLHRSYSWHVARNSSEILAAIEKISTVTNSVIVQLVQGGVALVIGLAILVTLLLIDARVALIAGTAFASLYGITSLISRRRLRRNARTISTNRTNRVRAVQEGLGGIRDVLLDGTQAIYHRRFAKFDSEMRVAQAGNAFISAYPRVFMEAAGVVLIMVLAYTLSREPGGLAKALPVLGALALGAQKLLPQMQQTYQAWSLITGSRNELDDVLALLDGPSPEQAAAPAGADRSVWRPLPGAPLIALRSVSFRYHSESPQVLESINLEIPRGIRIGIVGTTGSGKSTLVDLIMGLLRPCEGRIEIEGQLLHAGNLRNWQGRIAHVPQSIHLIDASIAENIALGTPPDSIDRAQLEEAARTSQLDEFVSSLPEQYRTTVGERGVRLSGGQRQRIGLARALYKRADVLVLDEATSALDNQTEQDVMAALEQLHGDKTVLMIAHRLSTIQNCDRIIVISNGSIAGCGSWNALIASNPVFQGIARMDETA